MYFMLSYKRFALVANTLLHPLPTFKPAKCGTVCINDDLGLDTIIGCYCDQVRYRYRVEEFLREILLIRLMDTLIVTGRWNYKLFCD